MKKLLLLSTFVLSVLSISGCLDENTQTQKVVQPQEEILPSRTK